MKREEIRLALEDMAEEEYRQFNLKIIPGAKSLLGVRMGGLRKLSKSICKSNIEEYFLQMKKAEPEELYYEELMVQGLVIGGCKIELKDRLELIKAFVPRIDNWAICDCFCGALKFTEDNKKPVWDFILPYLTDEREYFVRFGVVMLLSYFIEDEYIEKTITLLEKVAHTGYYARMAVAWAISICYVKFPDTTRCFLEKKENELDDFTFNKSIQKIRESYRVSKEDKEYLKTIKRSKT